MRIFEVAHIVLKIDKIVVVRVPDAVYDDPLDAGDVLESAERKFKVPAVLMASGTGDMRGSHHLRRQLQQIDQQDLKWAQWSMAE